MDIDFFNMLDLVMKQPREEIARNEMGESGDRMWTEENPAIKKI